ncbi:MAG: glycosyltransferase [Prevotella sp.]|nr:glycosyltransferase [Prevotella sp.]
MKALFVVQGEGHGHLTQALTLEKMLRNHGHEVVGMLVGRSEARDLPRFFMQRVNAPVQGFLSPNFLPSKTNQKIGLTRSIFYNIYKSPQYMASIHFLQQQIRKSGADVVINFYEILTGLTNFLFRPSIPMICIGHQYLCLHPDYPFPVAHPKSQKLMLAFTRATCLGAARKLALSFRYMPDDDRQQLSVVPPVLRDEALDTPRHHGNYITGYILNAGFSESVMQWHGKHPDIPMHFFWDKRDAAETTRIDDTLTFHRIDDHKFLHYLANCRAYATTGGFESVCEAMYMGKPVLMVPAHVEQECNAHEAWLQGAGVVADRFDMDGLLDFARTHTEDIEFRMWENEAELMVVSRIESIVEHYRNEHLSDTYMIDTAFSAG